MGVGAAGSLPGLDINSGTESGTPDEDDDDCDDECEEYELVYEASDKHRAKRYFSRGRSVGREPTNGPLASKVSFPTAAANRRRVGYDVLNKELVVLPRHGVDNENCIMYFHGWVVDYSDDLYGRTDILSTIRDNNPPMP